MQKLICVVGKPESTLAKNSDIVLLAEVEREACPLGLAPTTSTTVALALGDALAVCLLERHHFTPENFAVFQSRWFFRSQAIADCGKYHARW